MAKETRQWYYFTFGTDHALPHKAVAFYGTYSEARAKMVSEYGDKWAFQYSPSEWGRWHVAHPPVARAEAANFEAALEASAKNVERPVVEPYRTAYVFDGTQEYADLSEAIDKAITVGELMEILREAKATDKVVITSDYGRVFGTLEPLEEYHY